MLTDKQIAEICYEANRAYCKVNGDVSHLPWNDAPEWQRESAIDGVRFFRKNPKATPEDSHKNWLSLKEKEGWTYGAVKDILRKQHPCMMSYDLLPPEQRLKDSLFVGVVKSLL